ncbi:phosphate regulon sensor histidine kinase PhoR [Aquirhabdus sp.]|uniref:phosphate regulon sensor histidine kinase PhoR n=1 Tax=Aquirhabdus sp. TaxID=2824160 RepID=UPI00396CD08F
MSNSTTSLLDFVYQDLLRLIGLVLIFFCIGWVVGMPWLAVLLALFLFLLLQWYSLYRLYRWMQHTPDQEPPELGGVWSALLYNITRIQISEHRSRKNLLGVISRAQTSVAALEEAVVLIDASSLIEWWNPAAEKILGLKSGDQGRNILNFCRAPEFVSYYQQGNYSQEIKLKSWINEARYFQCKLTRFGQNDRLLVAYDVTRLHNLELMRKDFVDNVSHELRTPLTVLSGYLETYMDQDDLNPRWRRGFEQMRQQTTRMTNIVKDLLLLSRLENSSAQTERKVIDMPYLLNKIFDDAQAYNAEFKHELNLEIESFRSILGAEQELTSAFTNLITNAIKYTPKGGIIRVRWFDDGDDCCFSVTDNGIGIESHHINRLTERFYRVDSDRSRDTGGTGLGLAIVKHVMLQHEGRLEITSKREQGSTFLCRFPKERLVE